MGDYNPDRASRSGKLNANKQRENRPAPVNAIAQAVQLKWSLCGGGLSRIAREVLVRDVSVQLPDWSLVERNQVALALLTAQTLLFLLSLSLYI